ncbi:MAG: hypothetical protein AAGF07_04480 [Patescibacteria group bacterium]
MSFLKFSLFTYINLLLGLILVITPFVFLESGNNLILGVSVLGLLQLLVGLFTKNSGLPLPKLIDSRYFTLTVFLCAVCLNFAPYILDFTDVTALLWTVLACSGISLFSILFTNFDFLKQ